MAATPYLTKTGLIYLWGRIQTLFQPKETGKGLSTNDYTAADKAEVAKIASLESTVNGIVSTGGEANVLEGISVNGAAATITDKVAAITVPTMVSDLTNDSGFLTASDITGKADAATTYTKAEVDALVPDISGKANSADVYTKAETDGAITTALAGITGVEFVKADSLPASGEAGKFYLVPNSGAGQNVFDEYVWLNKGSAESPNYGWELLGTTQVDLSGYLQAADVTAITTAEIDEITGAGA